MGISMPARMASPEARTALFYSTLYLTSAVANPFLPIWLDDKGITPSQIGLINAVPIFLMIVLNVVVGRVADRAKDWRSVIVFGAIFGGFATLGLLFVDGFWGILIVWTLILIPFQAIAPVIDAAAIRMTRRRGSDFAHLRVWGTVGFVIVTIVGGLLLDWHGAMVFVPLLIAVNLLRAGVSLQLPLFRAPESERRTVIEDGPRDPRVAATIRQTMQPWFLLTLLGTALLHASHMLQMGFGALLWQRAGIPASAIGPLWAVAPACEILAMLYFARMARRFSARHLLLVACLLGSVRWFGLAFDPGIVGLVLLQTLHMASYGLGYMGIVNFVANWTTEDISAEAQSFFVVLRQAATVAALLVFGVLVAEFGSLSYLSASALALAGGAMIFASLLMMKTRQ